MVTARRSRYACRPPSQKGADPMPRVMTVLGPIAPEELGVTQTHEHLVLNLKRASHRLDALQNNEPLIVEEVSLFRQAGGRSIVDLTNNGMGRDPRAMKRIAEATGLHVVAGCGWYHQQHYDER